MSNVVIHDWSVFIGITLIMGGAGAYMTGRAVALTWRPFWHILFYAPGLAFAVRFIHYAMFGGYLLTPGGYLADLAVVILFALFGFRLTRVNQMVNNYRWLYQRNGILSWREIETEN